jgi:hypothetical protein
MYWRTITTMPNIAIVLAGVRTCTRRNTRTTRARCAILPYPLPWKCRVFTPGILPLHQFYTRRNRCGTPRLLLKQPLFYLPCAGRRWCEVVCCRSRVLVAVAGFSGLCFLFFDHIWIVALARVEPLPGCSMYPLSNYVEYTERHPAVSAYLHTHAQMIVFCANQRVGALR